jgi:hypothetical protein
MPPLEEPTVAEMIRALGSKLDAASQALARLEATSVQYVTQEQRTADQTLSAERERQQNEKLTHLSERATFITRTMWTAMIAPILVGVLLWLITRGSV